MSISVKCPCGAVHEMPESWAGKRGKCPNCGRLLAVPLPSARPPATAPPQPQPPPASAEPPKPIPAEQFVPFEMQELQENTFVEGAKKAEAKKEETPPPDILLEGNIIAFKCSCGKLLKASLDKVGKTAKCPACKKPINVPAPPEKKAEKEPEPAFDYIKEDAFEVLECPNCGAHMDKGSILCVQCGTNRISGEKVGTKIGDEAFADERKGLKDVLGKVAFWKKKKEE